MEDHVMRVFEHQDQAPSPAARIGPPMEHRFGRRHPCGAPVQVSAGAGLAGEGRLLNLSMSGAYIETALEFPLLALVSVTKIRRDDRRPVELHASVVRREANGVGIEWYDTPTRPICHLLGCAQPCHAT
jgi:hypothetical protein